MSHCALRRSWHGLWLLFLVAIPVRSFAQSVLGIEAAPTRGVYHPGVGIADLDEQPGAAAVLINPAALGDLTGYSLGLRHTETSSDTPFSGRGTALSGALPLPAPAMLSWLGRIKVGGAIEVLRPPALVPS